MTLTSILPRFSATVADNATVGAILSSQQVVVQVFLLSVMPVRLIDTLMAEVRDAAKRSNSGNSDSDKKNTAAQTSPDSANVPLEQIRTEIIRTAFSGKCLYHDSIPWIMAAQGVLNNLHSCVAESPPGLVFCIVFMFLFVYCARSSVGDAGIVTRERFFMPNL
jgi:hypothetical protein